MIPDLSTFGKGIANGFPLSAIAGKREIMIEMENIFFSGTFGGELLSLAAAKTVLELHVRRDVIPELVEIGVSLEESVRLAISQTRMSEVLGLSGHPTWSFLNWKESQNYSIDFLKTYFMQEMFQKGVLILGTHNVNLALTIKHRKKIEESYFEVLGAMSESINDDSLRDKLKVLPLAPLFTVR